MTVGHHSRHVACDARANSSTEPLGAAQHRHPTRGVLATESLLLEHYLELIGQEHRCGRPTRSQLTNQEKRREEKRREDKGESIRTPE